MQAQNFKLNTAEKYFKKSIKWGQTTFFNKLLYFLKEYR